MNELETVISETGKQYTIHHTKQHVLDGIAAALPQYTRNEIEAADTAALQATSHLPPAYTQTQAGINHKAWVKAMARHLNAG